MKAFVAPLYCQTNPLSQEKLALGLIMFAVAPGDKPTIFFKLSEKKILLAEKLADVSKSFFATAEKNIQNTIQNLKAQPPLVEQFTKNPAILDERVYQYLEQYAHGLLEFGSLKPFSGQVDKMVFEKLFADFTGDTSSLIASLPKKQSFKAKLKNHINVPELKKKADIAYQFTPDKLPGILKKTTAEVITVNGQVESLHGVDFTHEKGTVSNHLNELEVYYYALKDFVKGTSSLEKLTVAFNPPEPKSDQEKLFNTALDQKSSLFSFLPVNEIEDFAQSVSSHDYKKFSEVFG
jgi:hypothetical protein